MKQYLNLLEEIINNNEHSNNRTSINSFNLFGTQTKYNLKDGFPLLTTKKIFFKGVIHELLWFLSGSTNIKYLVDNNVNIWNEWPYENYKKSNEYKNETIKEFISKIKNDSTFAKKWGELGPVYGKQWRNFEGIDQIQNVINQIKNSPNSRRIIVSAWNPKEIGDMLLPPCHTLFQFYVYNGEISLQLYQRSADMFLGVPFNIASYALLLVLVADVCHLKPNSFIHTIGVAHIYENHLEQVKEQLKRKPRKLPKIVLKKHYDDITKYKFEDIEIIDYDPYPILKGKVAV